MLWLQFCAVLYLLDVTTTVLCYAVVSWYYDCSSVFCCSHLILWLQFSDWSGLLDDTYFAEFCRPCNVVSSCHKRSCNRWLRQLMRTEDKRQFIRRSLDRAVTSEHEIWVCWEIGIVTLHESARGKKQCDYGAEGGHATSGSRYCSSIYCFPLVA
jgi:hypothetical protein